MLAVAEAVAYAHSRHILHRDLKPANILVGEFGETLVIDWGLAKDLSEYHVPPIAGLAPSRGPAFDSYSREDATSESLTMQGAVIGTPAYMPPSRRPGTRSTSAPTSTRSGRFSITSSPGARLTAAALPWISYVGSSPALPLRCTSSGAASPRTSRRSWRRPWRAPRARYRTALELADDLRRFQTGQIVGAHVYSSRELLRRFVRRQRAPLLVALAVLAALIAVTLHRFFA